MWCRMLTAGMDSIFESNTFVFRDLKKSLREIIAEEKGMVTLDLSLIHISEPTRP